MYRRPTMTCFALKGGTAINLFVRDMPRLSVDTIEELSTARQVSVMDGSAPEVSFLIRPKNHWFMMRNGTNYAYLKPGEKLGPTGWIDGHNVRHNVPYSKRSPLDPWVICDGNNA